MRSNFTIGAYIRILLFIAILFPAEKTAAQFTHLATSPDINEYILGDHKLIQLTNNETALLVVGIDYDFYLSTFDANHKIKHNNVRIPNKSKFNATVPTSVNAIMAIGGKIVVFRDAIQGLKPRLYRYIIDPESATLESEEMLETLKIHGLKNSGYGPPTPEFLIKKDELSDHYVIAIQNSYEEDTDKRIEIIHYDQNHREISRAFYHNSANGFKYYDLIDVQVRGAKEVLVATMGRDVYMQNGEHFRGTIFCGMVPAGAKDFQLQKVYELNTDKLYSGMLKYDEKHNNTYLLCNQTRQNNGYTNIKEIAYAQLYILDREMNLLTARQATTNKIQVVADKYFTQKQAFFPTPEKLVIHDDGRYTIFFEELNYISGRGLNAKNYLEDIGIITYDKDGTELIGHYLPKEQLHNQNFVFKNRGNAAPKTTLSLFSSYFYIKEGQQEYILFNDEAINREKVAKNKKIGPYGVSFGHGEAFIFNLDDDQKIPQPKRLFSEEAKTLASVGETVYDPTTKTLALITYNLHKKSRDKFNIVWIKVD